MKEEQNVGGVPTPRIVEDFTQTKPVSTRSRVASENPATGQQARDAARFEASRQAALRAKADAEVRLREAAANLPLEEESQDIVQENALESSPPTNPQKLQHDLSLLATTGRIVDEVVVAGYTFRLHTPTVQESNEMLAATSFTGDELLRLAQLRIIALAQTIDTVNGVPLEDLYSDDGRNKTKLTKIQKRQAVVGTWQQGMVTDLFDFYDKMMGRSNAVFSAVNKQEGPVKN